jgi:2,3,4,5-tetrahydropyridine-2-carboxylate N-succinyltransferase
MADKNNYDFTDPYELARFLKDSKKVTPVRLYLKGGIDEAILSPYEYYGANGSYIVFLEHHEAEALVNGHKESIAYFRIEQDRRNSAVPMLDMGKLEARIEPGAFIREGAIIKKNAVVMMGAVINLGAVVGEETMIDMGAVLGARAQTGKRCHVGAGAVLAGVLEPPSKTPVILEDDVLIGANAVVLEGVRIGSGAVVAAGSIVTQDVAAGSVVAGSPAKFIKMKDNKTIAKTEILDDLRK